MTTPIQTPLRMSASWQARNNDSALKISGKLFDIFARPFRHNSLRRNMLGALTSLVVVTLAWAVTRDTD